MRWGTKIRWVPEAVVHKAEVGSHQARGMVSATHSDSNHLFSYLIVLYTSQQYRRLGVRYSRETTPEPGNRFRLRLRLRCVRACVRAKLRARDDSAVAGGGPINFVSPSLRPPGGGPGTSVGSRV